MFFNNRKQGHNFYENMANKHERFGIRKLTIGAVSVLLGATFWLSSTQVQAAELPASHAKETEETAEDKPAVTEPLDLSKSNEAANSGLNSDHAKDATGSNSLNDAVSGSVDDNKVEKGIANKDQATPVSDTAKTDAQKKVEQ